MNQVYRLLLVGCFVCSSACATKQQDDLLPTPIFTAVPEVDLSVGVVNEVARTIKKVDITVTLLEQSSCTVVFPYNLLRFELLSTVEPDLVVKAVEPVRRTFSFIERLEDNQTYAARIIYLPLDRELVKKTFIATQGDLDLGLSLPCRDGLGLRAPSR